MKRKVWSAQPKVAGYRSGTEALRGVLEEQAKNFEPRLVRDSSECIGLVCSSVDSFYILQCTVDGTMSQCLSDEMRVNVTSHKV
jgi:hypothetical protein